MRTGIFAASLAVSTLALTACAETADDTAADSQADTEVAADDTQMEADAATSDEVLDASTATAEELTAAGLSQDVAEAIVAGQPYDSVVALNAALPADRAADVLTQVFVPVNLNSATEEEIRLIPGMTDKMVHEFEEYRPYENMEEFDREIGKYVDAAEVARFRRYVTL